MCHHESPAVFRSCLAVLLFIETILLNILLSFHKILSCELPCSPKSLHQLQPELAPRGISKGKIYLSGFNKTEAYDVSQLSILMLAAEGMCESFNYFFSRNMLCSKLIQCRNHQCKWIGSIKNVCCTFLSFLYALFS